MVSYKDLFVFLFCFWNKKEWSLHSEHFYSDAVWISEIEANSVCQMVFHLLWFGSAWLSFGVRSFWPFRSSMCESVIWIVDCCDFWCEWARALQASLILVWCYCAHYPNAWQITCVYFMSRLIEKKYTKMDGNRIFTEPLFIWPVDNMPLLLKRRVYLCVCASEHFIY